MKMERNEKAALAAEVANLIANRAESMGDQYQIMAIVATLLDVTVNVSSATLDETAVRRNVIPVVERYIRLRT